MSEREKMLAGELYRAADPELTAARREARRLTRLYNQTTEEEMDQRELLLRELFGGLGESPEIEPPFRCDYGGNIRAGDGLYMNFGCVALDCGHIAIGNGVLFGPNVLLCGAYHPTDPDLRATGLELGGPITIGDNIWIGAGVVICAGVTIGSDTTIGAGSVVVRDIPEGSIAVGNPCRVIRPARPAVSNR